MESVINLKCLDVCNDIDSFCFMQCVTDEIQRQIVRRICICLFFSLIVFIMLMWLINKKEDKEK